MRSDIAHVMSECSGRSPVPSKKTHLKVDVRLADEDFEDLPKRAPISKHRQYGWDCKTSYPTSNALKRFLQKNIGRPWDKVYSEMHRAIDSKSAMGQEFFDHLQYHVEIHCHLGEDGRTLYENRQHRYSRGQSPVTGFYVHPKTKLLSYTKGPKPDEKLRRIRMVNNIQALTVDGNCEFRLTRGYLNWETDKPYRWHKYSYYILKEDKETYSFDSGWRKMKAGDHMSNGGRLCLPRELDRIEELLKEEQQYILATGRRLRSSGERY